MDVPALRPRMRLPDAERERIGQLLRREYDKGKSIRVLCAETGYSIGRVRGLLEVAGVEFRSRGGRAVRRRSVPTNRVGGTVE